MEDTVLRGPSLRRCPNCKSYALFTQLPEPFAGRFSCGECNWILDDDGTLIRRQTDDGERARRLAAWSHPVKEKPVRASLARVELRKEFGCSRTFSKSTLKDYRSDEIELQQAESEELIDRLRRRGIGISEGVVRRALCPPMDRSEEECLEAMPSHGREQRNASGGFKAIVAKRVELDTKAKVPPRPQSSTTRGANVAQPAMVGSTSAPKLLPGVAENGVGRGARAGVAGAVAKAAAHRPTDAALSGDTANPAAPKTQSSAVPRPPGEGRGATHSRALANPARTQPGGVPASRAKRTAGGPVRGRFLG